jgi:hydrogenase expression/formation protein HypE
MADFLAAFCGNKRSYGVSERRENAEEQVLARIEQLRRRPHLTDTLITLAHGSGGKATHTLIEALFLEEFTHPLLARRDDQAVFALDGQSGVQLAFTTDSFVVTPLFFPGGDIGRLAVNGTVNDLAMSGAEPLYLSAGFILEEGFPVADLRQIARSMAAAAAAAGVAVVTGDTKVVERGHADGLFINTAGIGVIRRPVVLSAGYARPGDQILLSGAIGAHGMAIMLARGNLALEVELVSDTAPLHSLVQAMLEVTPAIHCLKDATRGGVATVLNEIARQSEVAMVIDETKIPVPHEVRGACELLGIDPLYVANEGKLVAVVAAEAAESVLTAMRRHAYGRQAEIIGEVRETPQGLVLMRTAFGGTRIIDMLIGDPLPRIC